VSRIPAQPIHCPNPLDLAFFAIDDARRRIGLGGADIHLHLELGGRADLDGLRRALACAQRRYPVLAGRLHWPSALGRPHWRLEPPREDDARVEEVDCAAGDDAWHAEIERRLAGRVDWTRTPPFQLCVFRGPDRRDRVSVRWPHALMDARGGVQILEDVARFFEDRTQPCDVESAGDELRADFGTLARAQSWVGRLRLARRGAARTRPAGWTDIRAASGALEAGERVAVHVLRLSPEQDRDVRGACMRTCGFGRFADYLRACAIVALDAVLDHPRPEHGGYSTLHLVDNRRRRDPGPVCHNVFSSFPIFVPAEIAGDVRQIADGILAQSRAVVEQDAMTARLAGLELLTAIPTRVLARQMAAAHRTGRTLLPIGLSNAPSLPLGFMGPFSRPLPAFCGAPLENIFGIRPAPPRSGLALNVNRAQERMNITVAYHPPRVSRAWIERLVRCFAKVLTGAPPEAPARSADTA